MNMTVDPCAGPDLWSIETAFRSIVSGSPVRGSETLPLSRALGRVTALPVRSQVPLPLFDQSAMDGYAIHAEDVARGRTGPFRLAGAVHAGETAIPSIQPGTTARLLTGAPVPAGVGAVVMEELVDHFEQMVGVRVPPVQGDNIRRRGEDVEVGSTIIPAGVRLDPRHLALLAATGCGFVEAVRKVRVGLLSTGNELADPGEPLAPQAIYDSNRPMLMALLFDGSVNIDDLGRLPDDLDRMAAFLEAAHRSYDLIVTSGGVFGSEADHCVRAVQAAGGWSRRVSLAIKPGKPFAFGQAGECRILSLPGNPMAALVSALLFARPLICALAGSEARLPEGLSAVTAEDFRHRPGRTEFVPSVRVGRREDGTPLLKKLGKGGSARLAPLVAADGLAMIPAEVGDVPPGGRVAFHPFYTEWSL